MVKKELGLGILLLLAIISWGVQSYVQAYLVREYPQLPPIVYSIAPIIAGVIVVYFLKKMAKS